jgi:hypothetical protein
MSEQKKYNRIEDAIIELLDGESRENALKFAAYLDENQLAPNMSAWGKFTYNGYNLGHMWIEDGNWMFEIFDYLHFGDFLDADEEFTKAVHDHVAICNAPCHDECWRAKDVKIFGKEFKSVCSQHSRAFVTPDEKTMEHLKKLIEYSKKTTPYVYQWHPTHL